MVSVTELIRLPFNDVAFLPIVIGRALAQEC